MSRINNLNRYTSKEFLLVLFFTLMTANPFVRQNIEFSIIAFFIFLFFFFRSIFLIKKRDVVPFAIIIFFISFEIIHRVVYELDNLKTVFRLTSYYLAGFFFMKAIGYRFINYYIRLIYILSIVSIGFYAIGYLMPGFYNLLNGMASIMFPLELDINGYSTPTLIIYTFDPAYTSGASYLLRNPGFAWEAGAFATFVNIAFFFHLIINPDVKPEKLIFSKVSLIFIIAIILTFSTAGYIAFFFILLMVFTKKISFRNIMIITLIVLVAIFLFLRLEFLGEKVSEQLGVAYSSQNRFGAALLDWEDIMKSPWIGWSRDLSVLFNTSDYGYLAHRPNGITNFLRSYGFIYVTAYLIILFVSLKRYFAKIDFESRTLFSYTLVGIILLMGFSQLVVHSVFVMSFLFAGYTGYAKRT